MEAGENTIKLYYNTEVEPLAMPEYGRGVLKMIEYVKTIKDREHRSEQAAVVVRVMEWLNPQVKQQDNWQQKLWDHLYMIAGYDLDIDSPFPKPRKEDRESKPLPIPLQTKPVKARHYGRNIENILGVIAEEPEGETRTAMIHAIAVYMRQQYLIWNKDTVADETIFQDIERISGGKVKVPEGMELSRLSADASFSRPAMMLGGVARKPQGGRHFKKRNFKK